jgi:hypothetical protein
MEISLGRLRLNITATRAPERRKGWEEMTAIGMDDLELARLNQANTRDLDATTAEGTRLLYGVPRRV